MEISQSSCANGGTIFSTNETIRPRTRHGTQSLEVALNFNMIVMAKYSAHASRLTAFAPSSPRQAVVGKSGEVVSAI